MAGYWLIQLAAWLAGLAGLAGCLSSWLRVCLVIGWVSWLPGWELSGWLAGCLASFVGLVDLACHAGQAGQAGLSPSSPA